MWLKFSDSRIKEFTSGDFWVGNDGKAFEVSNGFGRSILPVTHPLDGENVPVFIETSAPKDAKADETKYTEASLTKLSKPALLKIATDLNIEIEADDNKDEIIPKILEATKEK